MGTRKEVVHVKIATPRMTDYVRERLDRGSEIFFGTKQNGGIIKEYDTQVRQGGKVMEHMPEDELIPLSFRRRVVGVPRRCKRH